LAILELISGQIELPTVRQAVPEVHSCGTPVGLVHVSQYESSAKEILDDQRSRRALTPRTGSTATNAADRRDHTSAGTTRHVARCRGILDRSPSPRCIVARPRIVQPPRRPYASRTV
jgi:hypothetical protein